MSIQLLRCIGWLLGMLVCYTLKAQLPQPVYAPCGVTATVTGVINTYYPGLNNINAGGRTITLGAPTGNTSPLLSGDRVLIIQMQDATINSTNTAAYGGNGTDGSGWTDLGYSGQYEFALVSNFTAGVLTLRDPLQHSYRAVSGIMNRKSAYQVVRVPVYQQVTLSGTLTATPWNGNAGGIIALHAWQTLDLNGNGISTAGQGFRPGKINSAGGLYNLQDYVRTTYGSYGEKGEGIAGTPLGTWGPTAGGYENGSFGRGAPANAGGGGNAHNSGGGGGANFGDGGKGGYQYSGPQDVGGRGGKGIKTGLPGRIIMGGGGGGGHQNNNAATGGAPGGGIIMITATNIIGAGTINVDGNNAGPSADDGAGGGGGGGSIVLGYTGAWPAGITLSARGGAGGNETFLARHGSGGGGGGGVILTSTPVATADVAGGLRGLSNGTEWGTVDGEPGSISNIDLAPLQPVSTLLPILQVKDTAVCAPLTVNMTDVITNRDQGPEFQISYWTDAAATIPVANPQAINTTGTYYIKLSNVNTNCVTIAPVQITVQPRPGFTWVVGAPACRGDSNGSIIPTPAIYQYSTDGGVNWQNAPINGLPAGVYNLIAMDNYGCISQPASITLTDPALLTLDEVMAAHTDVSCYAGNNGILQLNAAGGTSGYRYTVSSPSTGDVTNATGLFNNLPADVYAVSVSDAAQCRRSMEVTILQPTQLHIDLYAKTDLECEALAKGSITLTANGGVSPYWFRVGNQPWQRDSVFTGLLPGNYDAVVRDGNNCVTVPMETAIVVLENCDIIFPSAFTPNGDGKNDLFRPKHYGHVTQYHLNIYNRWGLAIFQSNDPAIGWDGHFKGALSDAGTFVWVANFINRLGQPQTMKGTVTLVK